MKKAFLNMMTKFVGSRKFMVGLPVLIALLCIGKIGPEIFLTGFITLFAANSYDKKKRLENGQTI